MELRFCVKDAPFELQARLSIAYFLRYGLEYIFVELGRQIACQGLGSGPILGITSFRGLRN